MKALLYVERLADGLPKRLEDFADITPHYKQRRRDLTRVAELPRVTVTRRGEKTWYRLDVQPSKFDDDKKRCVKGRECGDGQLPLSSFGKSCYSPDGRDWVCRACRTAMRRDWVARNRDQVNAKQRRNYAKRVAARKKLES